MSKKLNALMLFVIAVGVAHMGEQLLTNIEEFYMLRDALGGWYAMFPAAYADHATVMLITVVFTAISLVFYALMRGGSAKLIVAGVFGVFGITEVHHWIEAIVSGGYDPGVVTSVAYVWIGVLLLMEVIREVREGSPAALAATA